jgi:hypothetical protein
VVFSTGAIFFKKGKETCILRAIKGYPARTTTNEIKNLPCRFIAQKNIKNRLMSKNKGYKSPKMARGQKLLGFMNTERYESNSNNTARIFNFKNIFDRRLFNTT